MDSFETILRQHGLTPETYDFESTITAFDYEIDAYLLDETSVFDRERSKIYRQWDNPKAYVRADLITRDGNIARALSFFYQRWFSELRYENPVREILNLEHDEHSATIRALIISQGNAMTFLFHIR